MMTAMAKRPDPTALQRLADQVKARRAELLMSKIDVVRQAGLTPITYSKIETGESVRDVTYAKVEPVLGWAQGSCQAILGGTQPTCLEPSPRAGAYYSPITPGDLEGAVEQAVQDAAVAVTNLPASQIRALKQRVVDELRRQAGLGGNEVGREP